jgi:spore coat protein SA
MPGALSGSDTRDSWADYDCVLHIPTSENCGGVIEPLAANVPVVAARVGGLPEVIVNGSTGLTVEPNPSPLEAADAVLQVLEDQPRHREMSAKGARLVSNMFNVQRTAAEVNDIYKHVLNPGLNVRPRAFDTRVALEDREYAHA